MPSRNVEFQTGHYYHIYNRGNNRQLIFFERENYLFFLRKLREYLVNNAVEVVAYCLMPNHYHLLVYLNSDDLSNLMQAFTLSYTKAINKRYGRVGSLFQGRFQAIHVDRDDYLLHLSRYIHLNPVSANLIARPEEWEFSSYSEYISLRGGTLPTPNRVMSHFPSPGSYRLFVESNLENDNQIINHLMFDS